MNLYLIGYRGSGKSTIAPLIAEKLLWKWEDTDEHVETLAGCNISQIFKEYGEMHFREWETTVIEALSRQDELVIATGGGAPLEKNNRDMMKAHGFVAWLKAEPEVLWKRIASDTASETMRPNLTDQGGLEEVVTVLNKRTPVYEEFADYTIDVASLPPEQIAQQIVDWFDPVDTK